MKILFIHPHKFRRINSKIYSLGGLSETVLKRYIDKNDDITVIARIVDENESKSSYSEIIDPRIKILDISNIKRIGLKNNIKSADLIIVRLPCIIGNESIKIAKRYNKKYIVEVVGCAWDAYWNHGLIGKILAPWMFLYTKRVVKNANKVLYVSNEFLQKRYPTKGEQFACSDVSLPEENESVLLKRKNKIKNMKAEKEVIIGTIGATNIKYKGQQYVIRAIAKLKKEGYKLRYQIIGSGDNSYLKKTAIRNKVEKEVDFVGNISHDKIFNYLDNMDIYIQPSNLEGLCRALIEAMSRGCPCIASNAGGNIELINKTFIFKKKSINDLIKKIKNMTSENMEKQSYENFYKAKKYSSKKLEKIRKDFYKL